MNDDQDQLTRPQQMASFTEAVRQVHAPLSARQRMAGWQRLQQNLTAGTSVVDERASAWWPRVGLGLALASALIAVAIPVRRAMVKRIDHRGILQFVVVGGAPGDGARAGDALSAGAAADDRPVPGGVVSAKQAPLALVFSDGSRIAMRPPSRLAVSDLTEKGSDVHLLDGVINADVQHQRPDIAWTFRAGPYTVRVKGTSFALGWDADQRRLQLTMRSGAVSIEGPTEMGSPRVVVAGESLSLDEHGAATPVVAVAVRSPGEAAIAPTASNSAAVSVSRAGPVDKSRNGHERRGRGKSHDQSRDNSDWPGLLARGEFDEIVAQAESRGIALCLRVDGEQNLAALADAARYTHRRDLARQSLTALRARFPSTERARDAVFFLARLNETAANPSEALVWYERYLREAPRGSYAEEALGRQMMLLQRNSGTTEARGVARRYLGVYPRGVYAGQAAGLLSNSPSP